MKRLKVTGAYLLLPPFGPNEESTNTSAPFSQWEHNESFDSASACEDAQAKSRDFHYVTNARWSCSLRVAALQATILGSRRNSLKGDA